MTMHHAQIARLMREIAALHKYAAAEAKKEADLLVKANRATEASRQSKSTSMVQMKLKEAERATSDLASVKKKRADIAGKLADKSTSLRSYEARQATEDEKARKKVAEEQKKLMRNQSRQAQLKADFEA